MPRTTRKLKLFTGRDHSWMQFNRRVLEEAEDPANPLLERVKFLAITGSNLDEYVEIRQAGLLQRIEDGYREPGYDGLRPEESLAQLTADIHEFVAAQYRCWNEQLLPELRRQGIRLLEWKRLSEDARAYAQSYFQREVEPLLTPVSIDPAHPFPRVINKALCLALLLRAKRRSSGPHVLGVVTVPRALPRFVRLPAAEGMFDYLLLQDLIAQNLAGMYRGYEVLAHASFRVTRNSNLYFEEEEARSLLEPSVIEALYQASQAGVEVDLIVRGVCILRPGVKGLSERIRVRSVVGRFLEHSRIFHFANGGKDEIYLGSADWMPRNLFERCEVVFPVRDPAALARIHDEILPAYLADTVKARLQQPDGTYIRASRLFPEAPLFSSQDFLIRLAEGKTDLDAIPTPHTARPPAKATKRAAAD